MQCQKLVAQKQWLLLPLCLILMLTITPVVSAGGPVVSNVRAVQRLGTQLVDIHYDLASVSNALDVAVRISTDGGLNYGLVLTNLVGAAGSGVAPGTDRVVTWNAGVEWTGGYSTNVSFWVLADDLGPITGTNGMVHIPGGVCLLGNTLGENDLTARLTPTRIYISAFYMDSTPVTLGHWQQVYNYATNQGYTFTDPGAGKSTAHPVQTVNWYDAVKWCNARSEQSGKTPVYYTDAALTDVYKGGHLTPYANWDANGYRLPTQAEWEKAARGGVDGQRFPWGNTISQTNANYWGDTALYAYDSGPDGYNPVGSMGGTDPATSPVGSFAPNGYGLYDMSGNVWQWCWDWISLEYSGLVDPHGPASGTHREARGGSWANNAGEARCAQRTYGGPDQPPINYGFRAVCPPEPGDPHGTGEGVPVIMTQPEEQTVPAGSTVTFSVLVAGKPSPSYQWRCNGTNLMNGPNISGVTSTNLIITNLRTNDAGNYTVVVANGYGSVTSSEARLWVSIGGMFLIPGGSFTMGNTIGDTDPYIADAAPVTASVQSFYMDANLVSWSLWQSVFTYATNHGYVIAAGEGDGAMFPVRTVNWFDVVKWCNARSEQEGKAPVYYSDAEMTQVYRSGEGDAYAYWSATGYRLPTEAEWEKAARGGLEGKRFPWGDLISPTNARYASTLAFSYDLGPDSVPIGTVWSWSYTSPAGAFAPNGYGLYDMAGNLWEWCWDRYGAPYAGGVDPRGATTGGARVLRGGTCNHPANYSRTAQRYCFGPEGRMTFFGFRTVLIPSTGGPNGNPEGQPALLRQPNSQTVVEGQSASFVVVATGNPALSYQWQFNGTNLHDSDNISGVTGTNLVVKNVRAGDAGSYTVVVANSLGSVISSLAVLKLAPTGMVLIPAGEFIMGDEDLTMSPPGVTNVYVSEFCMDVNLISWSQWLTNYSWATSHGYEFVNAGAGKGLDHPVQWVDWYDCLKWCNARSQREGRRPAYYLDTAFSVVFTNGVVIPEVDWTANGYRLPTGAEWEKSARGGLKGQRFPWGNTISRANANYLGATFGNYLWDLGPDGYPEKFSAGGFPQTSPVGSFDPNGYGLYDMAGNVSQWCWDSHGFFSGGSDPHATDGNFIMTRGGSWVNNAFACWIVGANPKFSRGADFSTGFRCVVATGTTNAVVPRKDPTNGMVLIAGGNFVMGDTLDGMGDAAPVTNVFVSGFHMDANLVTWSQWLDVYSYATNHGYNLGAGAGKGPNHPVQTVNWYDTLKWCNARSRQMGRSPVYYTDGTLTTVYVTGELVPYVDWNAAGYRLPTEAEWQKAARGGVDGRRFPWGDLISQTNANYYGLRADYSYDLGPDGNDSRWQVGDAPFTSPVGSFQPNGYGLYDMAGNLWQWCWDWYGVPYAGSMDPHGSSNGQMRVLRGGSCGSPAGQCRVAFRGTRVPSMRREDSGLRTVLGSGLPSGMVSIPKSTFLMGIMTRHPYNMEAVKVSGFYMDQNLVRWDQWQAVYAYATNHGYDLNPGAGKGPDHPVNSLSWYDAVKWCNARSQQEGRSAAYFRDAGLTQVYTSGKSTPYVNWSAAGYRLPTDAEWEKAARGGAVKQKFPWGDTISQTNANYHSSEGGYDLGPSGYNSNYAVGEMPYTSPAGAFFPNGYGLYDMGGNLFQWCWDWAWGGWGYFLDDPHGASVGSNRTVRGGSWTNGADGCQSGAQESGGPEGTANIFGVRTVIPHAQ